MSEEIIKVLDYLGEKFGVAIDWTQENVLPYLQDLLSRFTGYRIAISVFWVIAAIAGFFLSFYFGKKIVASFKFARDKSADTILFESWGDSITPTVIGVFAIIGLVVLVVSSVCIFFGFTEELIKWIFIPELPMIEYLKGLVESY